ncbi:hypothetical protein AMES_0077 [Amycolatopsis mediterranei S699]|uniref:Uncharacterized protein n=2 Tax=Amycolatopsis mediterranei TaxID=33910 RepID=A0A0H3CVF8_AMYMU|nr:hypothetical protein [Amycolatopsis mediterranei]ADJ41904.1 conserved hypothetical protein [Amycolatopsis mediterranei U32]AEK38575.1 hypothetical protein RAM_00400 [Amycolatopsis mediterranei S699]AFO73614.1 hypothetical protein AMES_0077 [Amycolatopsis mediterranei S699]AGT80743.1 hypothetical protein B737_0078 [Amycolatopsis mediterranei RB]KDO09050.1 hypothetical protein DV26_20175 [Amycolatopsis mediterranei]
MAATPQNTERSTVAGGAKRSRSMPSRVVPPIELPASVDELARAAAAQLGWNGVVLPETTILGRKVCVVAKLRTDVHAERIAMGAGPVADRATVDTWTWPELAGTAPAPAAEIVGVLAVARHWRTAMASAVPFARYGEAAMVLPSPVVLTEDYVGNCLPRARAYGLAIVTADPNAVVDLDLEGRTERVVLAEDPVSRLVNELVYDHLLRTAEVPASLD